MICQHIINILELERIKSVKKNPDKSPFIITSYNNVTYLLKHHFKLTDPVKISDIENIPFTSHMKLKLLSIIKSNKVLTKKQLLYKQLTELIGVGPKLAETLLTKGVKSVSDLNNSKYFDILPLETQITYNLNILRNIPHTGMEKIAQVLEHSKSYTLEKKKSLKKEIPQSSKFKKEKLSHAYTTQVVGSYRRKSPYSKDVDVLLMSENGLAMDYYLDQLSKQYKTIVYSEGDRKAALVLKWDTYWIKIDIFVCNMQEYPTMLLYTTGSKTFNVMLRKIAKKKGMKLNQYSLSEGSSVLTKLKYKTEKDILKLLDIDLKYLDPSLR